MREPSSMFTSPYLWTTCQAGAEATLKTELARVRPDLRFGYSRPGFVTFKQADGGSIDWQAPLESVFARAWGLSLGKSLDWEAWLPALLAESRPWAIQVWRRRDQLPASRPPESEPDAEVEEWRARLVSEFQARGIAAESSRGGRAQDGQPVFSAILVQPGEVWFGVHRHGPSRIAVEGAEYPWPDHTVPSRAYVKCREAFSWARAPLKPGQVAMEWGSSPGGACVALLEQGLHVIGVDPGEMDPQVEFEAMKRRLKFRFLRKLAGSLQPHELNAENEGQVHWLLSDMNIDPTKTLQLTAKWLPELKSRGLLGVGLTLKFTDPVFAEHIPEILAQVRKDWGMKRVFAKQLSQHRQEIFLYAGI